MIPGSSGRIVTFYSYKGGTGRSMALANVAWVLASSGSRVLVVDWDLEAPGLHRYFRPFLADKELVRDESEGVIDFVIRFAQQVATPHSGELRDEKWVEKHADVRTWGKQLLWPNGEDAITRLGGYIHFIPSGRQGAAYARRVNSFDWSSFYQKFKGGAFIDAMRRSMAANYDWVLIDSRTGVSDTSGICTMQLPDTLVVCFTLNFQNIEGAAAVAQSAREGRPGGLRILPLPTRLDGQEDKLLQSMLKYARSLFDDMLDRDLDPGAYWRSMGIPYFARYAYSEKLAPFEEQLSDTTSTLPAFERLTSQITRKPARLEPLPEPHRAEALREFEQMPVVEDEAESPTAAVATPAVAAVKVEGVPLLLRRGWYWARLNTGTAFLSLVVAAMVGYQLYRSDGTVAPIAADAIPSLIGDAQKAASDGRRGDAALLIAEAAGRLDAAAIVGPSVEPGRQIYEALLRLDPLVIESGPRQVVQFSPDGQWLATTASGRETTLFRFPPQSKQPGTPAGYSVAAFSPDSRYLASAGRNGSLNVVDVMTGRRIWQWENLDPDSAWVTAVAFSPSGNMLAAGTDTGVIVVAEVEPWKELRAIQHRGPVDFLEFSSDSLYLATGGRKHDRVTWWAPRSKDAEKPVESFGPHEGGVAAMAFVPGRSDARARRMVTASRTGTIRLWTQTESLPETKEFGLRGTVLGLSPDGNFLATAIGPDAEVLDRGPAEVATVWRIQPGIESRGAVPLGSRLDALAFSRDGQVLVTGSARGVVARWRWESAALISSNEAAGHVTQIATSPDGRFIAFASDQGVWLMLPRAESARATEATLSAALAKALACTQTDRTQLSAEDWARYFGDEPLRFTCGAQSGPSGSTGANF